MKRIPSMLLAALWTVTVLTACTGNEEGQAPTDRDTTAAAEAVTDSAAPSDTTAEDGTAAPADTTTEDDGFQPGPDDEIILPDIPLGD